MKHSLLKHRTLCLYVVFDILERALGSLDLRSTQGTDLASLLLPKKENLLCSNSHNQQYSYKIIITSTYQTQINIFLVKLHVVQLLIQTHPSRLNPI